MIGRWLAGTGVVVLCCGLADPAAAIADKRFRTWQTAADSYCALVAAAKSGSSAALLTRLEETLEGRASRSEVERAMKPLVKLVQTRRPVTASAFELFVLDGEIADALVIVTFSGGVKLFTHMTLTSSPGGWSLLGFHYDVNWDKIQPRLAVTHARLEPVGCAALPGAATSPGRE